MKDPLVTVLVATYNQARFVRQALDSLFAQTMPPGDFEIIVVNDGSTDGTSAILQDYKDQIHLVERGNRGLIASCNEGLALAKSKYFARLDSDDFVAPEWLACLVEALHSAADACCAYPDRYEIRGEQWLPVKARPDNLYSLEACGTLFRTEMLRKIGGFRDFYWEEYDLYLRLSQVGRFLSVPRFLYMYRKHPDSLTHSASNRRKGWLQLLRVWGADVLRKAGFNSDLDEAIRMMEAKGV
jgi:glycosyltransferase involved in cell wall biosynthesis